MTGVSCPTTGSGTAPAVRPRVPRICRASLRRRRLELQLAGDPHGALDELGVVPGQLVRL